MLNITDLAHDLIDAMVAVVVGVLVQVVVKARQLGVALAPPPAGHAPAAAVEATIVPQLPSSCPPCMEGRGNCQRCPQCSLQDLAP